MSKVLVKVHRNGNWSIVSSENKPPACYDCKHREYVGGSWCTHIKSKVCNIITGESEDPDCISCQSQRYGKGDKDCGIEGKFFELKE